MTGRARVEAAQRHLPMSEDVWQARVMEYAFRLGWRVAHVHRAKTSRGRWVTPVSGSPGLPDLILSRAGVVLLAELKTEKGGFEPGQEEWITAAGEHGYVWRPSDWDEVQAVLGHLVSTQAASLAVQQPRGATDTRPVVGRGLRDAPAGSEGLS